MNCYEMEIDAFCGYVTSVLTNFPEVLIKPRSKKRIDLLEDFSLLCEKD